MFNLHNNMFITFLQTLIMISNCTSNAPKVRHIYISICDFCNTFFLYLSVMFSRGSQSRVWALRGTAGLLQDPLFKSCKNVLKSGKNVLCHFHFIFVNIQCIRANQSQRKCFNVILMLEQNIVHTSNTFIIKI